jgi:hypothetical protein
MALESRSTGRIERGLSRVRSRARGLLVLRAACLVLAAAVLVMVGIGALDYALRFPGAMRIGFLCALAAGGDGRICEVRAAGGEIQAAATGDRAAT